jgi:hypothetical protein
MCRRIGKAGKLIPTLGIFLVSEKLNRFPTQSATHFHY